MTCVSVLAGGCSHNRRHVYGTRGRQTGLRSIENSGDRHLNRKLLSKNCLNNELTLQSTAQFMLKTPKS